MTDSNNMSIWRLATNQGKMLDCMTPKWIRVLEGIEKYVIKQSGAELIYIDTETIEEEK